MNTTHESYLVPFFKEMNTVFPRKWCVLHSYETLPYYSASDVDMAFSGSHVQTLERSIKKIAKETGWVLLQKLWYDVQNCFYYVLYKPETQTLLAIDFLIDNNAIGKYGFKTSSLTANSQMVNACFPIPNSDVAFCYKLIKRIVKKRSLKEDDAYLRNTYLKANKDQVHTLLESQLGNKGKELILRYLTDKNRPLSKSDITLLHRMRKKNLNSLQHMIKFRYWETKRSFNRVFKPSGMILTVAKLEEAQLQELTNMLSDKLDILFRFVKTNISGASIGSLKGFVGSTLVICSGSHSTLKTTWSKTTKLVLDQNEATRNNNVNSLADFYFKTIVRALADRMTKRMHDAH